MIDRQDTGGISNLSTGYATIYGYILVSFITCSGPAHDLLPCQNIEVSMSLCDTVRDLCDTAHDLCDTV